MEESKQNSHEEGIRNVVRPSPQASQSFPCKDVSPVPFQPKKSVIKQDFTIHQNVRGLDDTHYPPWAGPVGGPLVVGLLAAVISGQYVGGFSLFFTLGGAAAGLLLGVVLWFCDRPSGRGDFLDVSDQGSFIGRFLALVSCFLFCFPIVGLIVSSGALLANWRPRAGWPRLISRISFVLALLISGVFYVALLFGS